MRDDDSARRHAWGDLAQAPGDVFVGQTVETVSPDTLGVEALRNGKVVRNRTVAVMKGGIEAGNLKQFRSTHQQRPDRCEVVRLMQGCEGHVLLEIRDHALVDDHRPVIFRPAMDDPVANRDEVEALGLPEPSRHHGNRRGNVGDLVRRIAPIDQRRPVVRLGKQPRPRADPVDLALDQAAQRAAALNAEYLELDAGRACIDDEDRIHGSQAFGNAAIRRRASA